MSFIQKAQNHPVFAVLSLLFAGWVAGIGTYKTGLEFFKYQTIAQGSYVKNTDIDALYVRKAEAQRLYQLNQNLEAALASSAQSLEQERAHRISSEGQQSSRTEICRNILSQINALQAQQNSIELSIQYKANPVAIYGPRSDESKQNDAFAIQELRRQSAQIQENLLELRKRYVGCAG